MKPWYESQTIRALIVSAIAQLLSSMDLEGDAATIADAILHVVAFVSLIWAAYGRRNAVEPLSLTKGVRDETDSKSGV